MTNLSGVERLSIGEASSFISFTVSSLFSKFISKVGLFSFIFSFSKASSGANKASGATIPV